MRRVKSAEIARVLREMGQRLEMKGDSVFRARADARAAKRLDVPAEDLADGAGRGGLHGRGRRRGAPGADRPASGPSARGRWPISAAGRTLAASRA